MDQKFKELQTEWYKKLKDDGFEDAENADGLLKHWSSYDFRRAMHDRIGKTAGTETSVVKMGGAAAEAALDRIFAKTNYYRLATHLLNAKVFNSAEEKTIWEHHSNGVSIRDIISKLSLKKRDLHRIHDIILRLKKVMLSNNYEE